MALKDIKGWGPEVEKKIIEEWKNSEKFNFDSKTKKQIFSIDTPPPYINAPIHIGQAITYCYMDFFARYKRMKEFEVLFPLGLDRNGLPIEMGVEKKYGVNPQNVSREEFLKYCEKLLDETSTESTDTFKKLGISFTSYKKGKHIGAVYWNDSSDYRALTQTTFSRLYKKGLVYQDTRINNWDPVLQTTIADSEIEYKEVNSSFNYVKWKVKETNEEIIIATTRPELICTCGMVIFNPEDERYKHLEGKTAISPIFEKEIPIKAHKSAEADKGTGIVMMCSAGDLSDVQFFRNEGLKPVIAIEKDGTMNEYAGPLKGLKVKEARKKIIETIKEKGLLEKQEQIFHRAPVSDRTKAEIEFIEMDEWYVEQLDFKKDMKKFSEDLNFYPPEAKKLLDDWIDSITIDWPISRRRYYATPVPVWYSEEGEIAIPPENTYVQPWKENPPKDAEVLDKSRKIIGKVKDFPKKKWEGDTRVFDTWFDSSISELYIANYGKDDKFFKKAYPVTLRPQGKEIIRTWLYYTLLRARHETEKIPFRDVWIHQHILDGKGYKMSKSKGNIIDPQDLLRNYGGEAIRFWAATEGDLSKQDLKCSEERIKAELKTIRKLLNVSKFIMQFEKPKTKLKKLEKLDELFIDYIEELTKEADKKYNDYDFFNCVKKLRRFIWDIFASHYIEMVKPRAYNQNQEFSKEESESARYSLHYILERLLLLLYPVIPQVTTTISKEKNIYLLEAKWPKEKKRKSDLEKIDEIIEFNSGVWKKKKDSGVSLSNPIEGIKIPNSLKDFEKDLKKVHKI